MRKSYGKNRNTSKGGLRLQFRYSIIMSVICAASTAASPNLKKADVY